MLVSHRYKFIYTKTVKTASTSIESYFERFCMHEGEWVQGSYRDEYVSDAGIVGYRGTDRPEGTKWFSHMKAKDIRAQLGEDVWNSYYKFCSIRNPYDKCISAFSHLGKKHQLDQIKLPPEIKALGLDSQQQNFIAYLREHAPTDYLQYKLNGKFGLDDVIRFETMLEDIERICGILGLPYEPDLLPRFKVGIRKKDATVDALYSRRARNIVERKFAFELEQFGYRFPE